MTKDEFCSHGLLAYALTGYVNGDLGECGKILADIIKANYPERLSVADDSDGNVIVRFNDHKLTTWEDVERVFEKAEVAYDERI